MIDPPIAFLVFKALLGFGLPIAVCIQQLVSIKRSIHADREAAAQQQAAASRAVAPIERPAKAA